MKNFSQKFVKTALCGVVGSERDFKRVWDSAKSACKAIAQAGGFTEKGKPTEETVCYKIGGTYYEVSTSCGGSERLRDKMIRLIKSETVKPPNDKQG